MAEATPSGTASEYAESEMPISEIDEPTAGGGFPPYPPYAAEPAPPSVADTIIAGRDLRVQHKSGPKQPVRPLPKPARPRGPKATDVKLSKRAARAHARCLRKHNAVLTDRLERMAKPLRRSIIHMWREHAHTLPPEAITRFRAMLDADEPFKPDQAYEYFINLRKNKKKATKKFKSPPALGQRDDGGDEPAAARTKRKEKTKRDVLALCCDKRFIWARNATVALARGIQQRLSNPATYSLTGSLLRLSNIILGETCIYMHMRKPSRQCSHPKAKFMMEMCDKIAVWIDEILAESDDRMLMMDFDEDEDLLGVNAAGDAGFADDFLNMMGDGGLLKGPQSAYLKFTGEMLEAFMILTDSMYKKENEQLLSYGKFKQTYAEGADELKETPDFEATEYNTTLANKLKNDLDTVAKPNTPSNLTSVMKDIVEICSNYLAQHAEFNRDKGPAFKLLVKAMKAKGNETLYQKGKAKRNYGKAATELEKSRGLESDHDDPNLSQEIHSKLSKLVQAQTPADLKADMTETIDLSSKYLSQCAIDEVERGPAFDILIQELEKHGADPFAPQFQPLYTNFAAAYALKSAPGLSSITPDPGTAPMFMAKLHRVVDTMTPKALLKEMHGVIERCANYLSAFVRDRDKAMQALLQMMKGNAGKELAKRNNYVMNYGTAATEVEGAPIIIPFMPVKDIADEAKEHLTKDMEGKTAPNLKVAMQSLIQDVSRYLSQPIAMRSGVAGERYPLSFLAAVKKSLGSRPLFKYKVYGQTYADAADVLKYAGPLEYDPKSEDLKHQISSEMKRGVPSRLAPSITANLSDTMEDASKHLAKIGIEKGAALQHLVNLMKDQGEAPLGHIQGYQQSYNDGARRIENANSLTNEKVDKGVYESVRGKLTELAENKPAPEHARAMPGIIDESSKFLASPFPENESEKRRVLADLMARKGDEVLGKQGLYKLTYTEGGEEIMKAPVGAMTSQDEATKKQLLQKVNEVIPEKKLQDLLKVPANEGATYIADIIKGRGEAMQVIHDGMEKDKDKDFLTVGKFSKTHSQAAEMLETAPHFGGQHPSPVLVDKVAERIKNIPASGVSNKAKPFIADATDITTQYIAGVATKECGLDAKQLAALEGYFEKGSNALASVGTGAVSGASVGAGVSASTGAAASSAGSRDYKDAIGASAHPGSTDDDERRRKEAEDAARKKREDDERKRREAEEAERRRKALEYEKRRRAAAAGMEVEPDPEREQAMAILHGQLRAHGAETFYKQPHTDLSHAKASEWLAMKPAMKVDKSVKESGDTARLHKKFERKLSALVSKSTPSSMYDTMQDVIIESARFLSEYFVSKSYKALVRLALISEMQKRGNEILIEVDGAAETYFFSAQRLKKAATFDVTEPCIQVSYTLTKKLEDMIRCRSMARKLTSAMKDHIKDAADYLSALVTRPDEQIEAYVALLNEMEAAGDGLLIEEDIPKSYKDAAAYLRQLTSFQDEISKPNSTLQSATEAKLKSLMTNTTATGYTKAIMDGVITESTRLLVSYIMLQVIKTEALKCLIERMDQDGVNVLLRHGRIRKTYSEGADLLRTKNSDQLRVSGADPVVTRKIQIKLFNLMHSCTPEKYQPYMDDVIEDATMYLAVHLLQPQVIQVCKCMKNVFVQCELWCDEILRRVARPCCTCSRHISVQALADLAPAQQLISSPGTSRAYAPGVDISITPCPSNPTSSKRGRRPQTCPAAKPTDECDRNATTSYLLYSTVYQHRRLFGSSPVRLPRQTPSDTPLISPSSLTKTPSFSPMRSVLFGKMKTEYKTTNINILRTREISPNSDNKRNQTDSAPESFHTPQSANTDLPEPENDSPFWQTATTMLAEVHSPLKSLQIRASADPPYPSTSTGVSRTMAQFRRGYSARAPIVTTDQMSDWHAMMVSLMWNIQAWRDWIQENIDRAQAYRYRPNEQSGEGDESWTSFQRRVATEALQWRQYNNFSRQLTLRLALRYRDKKIVSPTRATVKTEAYLECQREMLDIIDMFNRWTHWLSIVVKETDSLRLREDTDMPLYELRWKHFKKKVEEYSEDWAKYNTYLKGFWEHKYRALIADWFPAWKQAGPVWVVSACGAVPSGAVAAGVLEGEVTWVARTTHRCEVLPAALHPSKHCCVVYADGAVHHYTKYQVLCNAEVSWVACRAGAAGAASTRAVSVARGVLVGRVQYRGAHLLGAVHAPAYRCHVCIFGRPFAFNCYELLALSAQTDE